MPSQAVQSALQPIQKRWWNTEAQLNQLIENLIAAYQAAPAAKVEEKPPAKESQTEPIPQPTAVKKKRKKAEVTESAAE